MSKVIGGETKAWVKYDENGNFVVVDAQDNVGAPCKFCDKDDKTIVLTANESGCKWINRKKVATFLDDPANKGKMYPLETRGKTEVGTSVGNLKLPGWIKYLDEDDKAAVEEIFNRAKEAMMADVKKPLTEKEKLLVRIAKLQAKVDAISDDTTEE